MTGNEWLNSREPQLMLAFHGREASERKLRLFALACCQRIEHLLSHPNSREAVAFLATHLDQGLFRKKGLPAIRKAAQLAALEVAQFQQNDHAAMHAAYAALVAVNKGPIYAAQYTVMNAGRALWWSADSPPALFPFPPDARMVEILTNQAELLREIIGNPLTPTIVAPCWGTREVIALAQASYATSSDTCDLLDAERLGILADALEDAGCDNADILAHLRGPGPHVRGCWALDLLLGKG